MNRFGSKIKNGGRRHNFWWHLPCAFLAGNFVSQHLLDVPDCFIPKPETSEHSNVIGWPLHPDVLHLDFWGLSCCRFQHHGRIEHHEWWCFIHCWKYALRSCASLSNKLISSYDQQSNNHWTHPWQWHSTVVNVSDLLIQVFVVIVLSLLCILHFHDNFSTLLKFL